jgi:hypothetical protein
MIIDGILILYTSDPTCPQMRTCVQALEAAGREVFLKPLTHLQKKQRPAVTPALKTLGAIQPN